ncbi:MAG: endonuclease/exonuclease/phosphatase family protein, partial [Geminicoccaceae bacterium]
GGSGMRVSIGTFNVNNLFSRWNFQGEVDAFRDGDTELTTTLTFQLTQPDRFRLRTFQGRLVQGKPAEERARVARRIIAMNADVLALQEVEDIDTLRRFVSEDLGRHYPHLVLVEGNDPRLIDVALLSKLPIGAVVTWQHATHPLAPNQPVFGSDLLEVEILNPTRRRKLFTIFNNHLKSHFVPFDEDPELGAQRANERRRRQAETVARIVAARTRPNSRYAVLGDLNDPPGTQALAPFGASGLRLHNALADPEETRPAKADTPAPASKAWTHRFKPSGQPAEYELYDQIWLSPALAERARRAVIDRRTRHGGDGSDHDPAWVEVEL